MARMRLDDDPDLPSWRESERSARTERQVHGQFHPQSTRAVTIASR